MKKRILVLCPSPHNTAPTQRLKYEQYFNEFKKEGYEMVISSFQTQRFWEIIYKPGKIVEKIFWTLWGYFKRTIDLFRLPFYDGVYISLWVTPLGLPFYERLVTLLNKNVIYDIDDMIHKNDDNNKRFIDRLKGKNKPITLIKHSKYVIVCTPDLEKFARQMNPNVIDISSTFNTQRFKPVENYNIKEPITIGWTGTHSTLKYLNIVESALQNLAQKRNIKLLIISNKEHKIENVPCEWIQWSSSNEVQDLHKMDIGLYPVETTEWTLGKSGLKALTYMSIAIPAIATNWGAINRIVDHEINGLLVNNTEEEWEQAMLTLVDSVELRKQFGQKGREKVEQNFSIEANKGKYLKAFDFTYG